MPRSRQAEVQSVVSWHEVVRARHRLFGGIGRGGQQKGARVKPAIWNTVVRERCAWQLRGTAVRQKAERLVKRGIADISVAFGRRAHQKALESDGNDGLIVCDPRVGGRPRRICGPAKAARDV